MNDIKCLNKNDSTKQDCLIRKKSNLLGYQMLLFWSLLILPYVINAQPQVEVFTGSELPEYTFAGRTADHEYIAYMKSTGNQVEIIKTVTNGYGIEKFSPEVEQIREVALSPDGKYLVWSEKVDSDNSEMKLMRYDYATEIITTLTIPEFTSDGTAPTVLKKLKFIKETGKLTYLLGYGYDYDGVYGLDNLNLENVVAHDIVLDQSESIQMKDFPVANSEWHSISDYDFSDDGSRLIYQINAYFTGTDSVVSRAGYIVVLETQNHQILHLKDLSGKSGLYSIDVSGNGEFYAFHDGNEFTRVSIDDGQSKQILDPVFNRHNNFVNWLKLSQNGEVIAASGNGSYLDGNRLTGRKRFGDYATVVNEIRPRAILVVDVDSGKSEIVNKFSNSQLFFAEPLILEDDGESIFFQIQQSEFGLNRVQSYFVSHKMTYEFKADESITGGWYDSQNPGHGINIHLAQRPEGENALPVVTWYTVDADGQPFWIIMNGNFEGNRISGIAYYVSGSQFGENYNAADTVTTQWGEMTIEFSNCQSAQLTYQPSVEGFEAGQLDLGRLFVQQGVGCL